MPGPNSAASGVTMIAAVGLTPLELSARLLIRGANE
jgi:hypothetical protein